MARRDSMLAGGGIWHGSQPNGTVASGVAAAGATQATATLLTADCTIVSTVALSSGVRLPPLSPADSVVLANYGANPLAIYPPSGVKLNNAAVDVSVALPLNKAARVVAINATDYIVNVGA